MSYAPSLTRLDDAPREAVRFALAILYAYHKREADRLTKILEGYEDLLIDKLAKAWEKLTFEYGKEKALGLLTTMIAAELDGGESPLDCWLESMKQDEVAQKSLI
jgi:hypothetical protein